MSDGTGQTPRFSVNRLRLWSAPFWKARLTEPSGLIRTERLVRYERMPLNPGSVAVLLFSASDVGEGESLTLPPDYDGGMGAWTTGTQNYFFAFHNATHDRTPFGVRFPTGLALGSHPVKVMRSGEFILSQSVMRIRSSSCIPGWPGGVGVAG